MAKNTWFEETFLPSFDSKMNNPKYPNKCIITERQAEICEKYMRYQPCVSLYGQDFGHYKYDIGTKHYSIYRAGRYTFLHLIDDTKAVWAIKESRTLKNIITFKTEKEMQNWIDENVDEETGRINGTEYTTWTDWTTSYNYKMPEEE